MSIFDHDLEPNLAEAERTTKSSKHYEQELDPAPEYEPVTDTDRERLLWGNDGKPDHNESVTDRTVDARFSDPDGRDWVSPSIARQRRKAMLMPNPPHDLADRITKVMRFDAAPKAVADAATQAREAVELALEAVTSGRSLEQPRYAASQQAKDDAVQAIAKATAAVGALERTAEEHADAWFDSLVTDIPAAREKAQKALDAAARDYATWQNLIAGADALAREQERFGDWHLHPTFKRGDLLALIGELRKARDIANDEDEWVSGAYLTAEYEGIPPHTAAYLRRDAEVAGYESYAGLTLQRMVSIHPADGPAREAVQAKDLRILHSRPVPDLMPGNNGPAISG